MNVVFASAHDGFHKEDDSLLNRNMTTANRNLLKEAVMLMGLFLSAGCDKSATHIRSKIHFTAPLRQALNVWTKTK